MKDQYKIKSDFVLKIFLTYININDSKANIFFTFDFLIAILYLQKRIENENKNEIFLFKEFKNSFDYCYYQYKYNKIVSEEKFAKDKLSEITKLAFNEIKLVNVQSYCKFLGEEFYKTRNYKEFVKDFEYRNDKKKILRMSLRRDNFLNLYLENICGVLFLELNKNLEKSFVIFCHFYISDENMFVPENFIYFFVYLYIINKNIELDLDRIEKKHCYIEKYEDTFRKDMENIEKVINDCDGYLKDKREIENKLFFSKCFSKKKRLRRIFCFLLGYDDKSFFRECFYFRMLLNNCFEIEKYEKKENIKFFVKNDFKYQGKNVDIEFLKIVDYNLHKKFTC
ncbi:hypothetical protein GVAV_002116 [Gurleya vavrai]